MSTQISGGVEDGGIVVGNVYDKYASHNPIVRLMMNNFSSSLSDFVSVARPESIHEVGCGEGYWVFKWIAQGLLARGSDFSSRVVNIARANAVCKNISPSLFSCRNIYNLDPKIDSADLIVCCEVLEHLEFPEVGLQSLQKIVGRYLIVSVPREPLWCVLNMARGKYLSRFGNTPGHIQHWSKSEIFSLVSKYFTIVDVKVPFPWTMLLCRKLDNYDCL